MVIIIAISCAGRPKRLKGLSTFSSASVSCIGLVTKVKSEVPTIKSTSLSNMKKPSTRPSCVIFKNPYSKYILPP